MSDPVARNIFIAAITAPTPSTKHIETSCTAGFDENGKWYRIYPVPLRKMARAQSYRKYQWVRFDTFAPTNDPRPESRKCNHDSIRILSGQLPWADRMRICIENGQKIYTDFDELLMEAEARPIRTSLAVFKPSRILQCTATDVSEERIRACLEKQRSIRKNTQPELNFTDEEDSAFIQADPPLIDLKYRFEDSNGRTHNLTILDWEAYMLYRKQRANGKTHEEAKKGTIDKFSSFIGWDDVYLFLGTRKDDHIRGLTQPFSIIGILYPPKAIAEKKAEDKANGQLYLF